jgi:hypothetical protein
VGAGAFFALLRVRFREREAKKEHESAKKSERERKKREFALLLATYNGNPVSEPKDARHGGKKGS